jgi:hypothetical protein
MVETVGLGTASPASRTACTAETGGRESVMLPTYAASVEIDSSVGSAHHV